jgi:uncharacterized protein YhaN
MKRNRGPSHTAAKSTGGKTQAQTQAQKRKAAEEAAKFRRREEVRKSAWRQLVSIAKSVLEKAKSPIGMRVIGVTLLALVVVSTMSVVNLVNAENQRAAWTAERLAQSAENIKAQDGIDLNAARFDRLLKIVAICDVDAYVIRNGGVSTFQLGSVAPKKPCVEEMLNGAGIDYRLDASTNPWLITVNLKNVEP